MGKRSHLPAVLLIVSMVAVAGYTLRKEMIFPEAAALAFGAWVMEETPWRGAKLNLWLSPTLAALTGVLMLRVFPYSLLFMVPAAFVLVALQLSVLRSSVMPSISAAVLPLLLKCESWYYPLGVCAFTGIIAAGHYLNSKNWWKKGQAPAAVPGGADAEAALGLRHWGKLLLAVMAVCAVAIKSHWIFVIAPPLIVSFVELSKPEGQLKRRPVRVFFLLSMAALTGAAWLYLIHDVVHWPLWVPAGLSVLSVFFLYELLQVHFPPAAAIALLPVIIPAGKIWSYPLDVSMGSALFISISTLLFV